MMIARRSACSISGITRTVMISGAVGIDQRFISDPRVAPAMA
jgi:hypothetical protein